MNVPLKVSLKLIFEGMFYLLFERTARVENEGCNEKLKTTKEEK